MLTELFSTNNYISFNTKIANVLGLHTAIYISELININNKAIQKNKINDEGFFKVDRKYITSRTTLDAPEQKEIESKLANIKVIKISNEDKDCFKVDLNILANIVTSDNVKFIDDIINITKNQKQPKVTQRQGMINNLKNLASYPTSPELDQAYKDWVDGVYANPKGFLSGRAIKIFQQTVDDFAKGNLKVALKIIDIATVNGYRDASWAINIYNKEYPQGIQSFNNKSTLKTKVTLSDEVF